MKQASESWAAFLHLKARFLSGIYVIAQSTTGVNWSHEDNTDGWFPIQLSSGEVLVWNVAILKQAGFLGLFFRVGRRWCAVRLFVHLRETLAKKSKWHEWRADQDPGEAPCVEPASLWMSCSSKQKQQPFRLWWWPFNSSSRVQAHNTAPAQLAGATV